MPALQGVSAVQGMSAGGGGGASALADVLAQGATTGGTDITISSGDQIIGTAGAANHPTYTFTGREAETGIYENLGALVLAANGQAKVTIGSTSVELDNLTHFRLRELSSAPTGIANKVQLYGLDDGAGRTQLFANFGGNTPQLLVSDVNNGGTQAPKVDPATQHGRLTLTTAVSVPTSDETAQTTLYFTPHNGNLIALYDGSVWNYHTLTEISLAVSGFPSGGAANTNYDIFCYSDSGTLTLEAVAWSDSGAGTSARATALVEQDGVLVQSGATSRRYAGTVRTTGSTQLESSSSNRYVWNYNNRVRRNMYREDATSSWTYASSTTRQAGGDADNELRFVIGVSEDAVSSKLVVSHRSSVAGDTLGAAIGLNGTTIPAETSAPSAQAQVADITGVHTYCYDGLPGIGYHELWWLEWTTASSGTLTVFGSDESNLSGALWA